MKMVQKFSQQVTACFVVVSGLLVSASGFAGSTAGMAMDVQGQVIQTVNGSNQPIKLLDYVQAGSAITVSDKASLSLTLYAEKKLYKFQGPSAFKITADGQFSQSSGTAPVVKPLAERTLVASQQGSFIPGSTRMRSAMAPVVLMSPAKGSIITEGQPDFSWASAQSGPYNFRLLGADGKTVWESVVQGQKVALPKEVKLQAGVNYKWQVSLEKGHGKSDRGQFSIADTGAVKSIRAAAPPAGAPIDELVLYAVDLRDAGYVQEARKVVHLIGDSRPDLADAILSAE
jgi:hypothetical protein